MRWGDGDETQFIKRHREGSQFTTNECFFTLKNVRGSILGKFIGFYLDQKPLAFEEKFKDQLGDPRTNLEVFGDEVSFQECWQS